MPKNGRISENISEAVKRLFGQARQSEVITVLERYGTEPHEREVERVYMAVLKLSEGDLQKLAALVEEAKADMRNVLWWAEREQERCCRGQERRKNDLLAEKTTSSGIVPFVRRVGFSLPKGIGIMKMWSLGLFVLLNGVALFCIFNPWIRVWAGQGLTLLVLEAVFLLLIGVPLFLHHFLQKKKSFKQSLNDSVQSVMDFLAGWV